MTLVGHSLAGATVAVLTVPLSAGARRLAIAMAAFAVLANIPDLRLPYWGHEEYGISHSVFVSAALILLLSVPFLFSARARCAIGGGSVVVGGAFAWLSHLLLDTFYSAGHGLGVFWPFSEAHLALPIPWFEPVLRPLPHFDSHTARVWSIELVSYGVVFIVALLVRYARARHRRAGRHVNAASR